MFRRRGTREKAPITVPFQESGLPLVDWPMGSVDYTVLDVETTGFRSTDRVIEIAARRIRLDGTTIAEFETLVNPGRSATDTTHIHGISDRHLVDAPYFSEIAGDLDQFLAESICVGHNVGFDIRFIRQEMERIAEEMEHWPALCTMRLSALRGGPARSTLKHCHRSLGCESVDGAHRASVDVQMTSEVLLVLLSGATEQTFRSLGTCETAEWMGGLPESKVRSAPSGRRHSREETRPDATMSAVTLTGDGAHESCLALYRGAVDAALEDRLLEPHEVDGLISLGSRLGVSPEQAISIIQSFFEGVVARAIADHRIDETEQRDLERLAVLFELDRQTVDRLMNVVEPGQVEMEGLEGLSVCFTGGISATRQGLPLTRADLQASAQGRGMIVKTGVSKKLDMLVTSDPHSMSGKSKKAKELGTRVVDVDSFIGMLGIEVD